MGDPNICQGQGPSNATILDFRHDFQLGIYWHGLPPHYSMKQFKTRFKPHLPVSHASSFPHFQGRWKTGFGGISRHDDV